MASAVCMVYTDSVTPYLNTWSTLPTAHGQKMLEILWTVRACMILKFPSRPYRKLQRLRGKLSAHHVLGTLLRPLNSLTARIDHPAPARSFFFHGRLCWWHRPSTLAGKGLSTQSRAFSILSRRALLVISLVSTLLYSVHVRCKVRIVFYRWKQPSHMDVLYFTRGIYFGIIFTTNLWPWLDSDQSVYDKPSIKVSINLSMLLARGATRSAQVRRR